MAAMFLHPVVAIIFVIAVLSAVLSTVVSAILAPATVLAQNVFPGVSGKLGKSLWMNRLTVLLVAGPSLGLAYAGESAWSMLEGAYELTLAGLLVPMLFTLFVERTSAVAAVSGMLTGSLLWLLHYVWDWEYFLEAWFPAFRAWLPSSLGCTLASTAVCVALVVLCPRSPSAQMEPSVQE
jgi:Na+/proline symporter